LPRTRFPRYVVRLGPFSDPPRLHQASKLAAVAKRVLEGYQFLIGDCAESHTHRASSLERRASRRRRTE
jgi:hypothetical protein